jgi:hypothetical protein
LHQKNLIRKNLFEKAYVNLLGEIPAKGSQGALFEKTAPWTPAKTFY